jgi:hypothetical protein
MANSSLPSNMEIVLLYFDHTDFEKRLPGLNRRNPFFNPRNQASLFFMTSVAVLFDVEGLLPVVAGAAGPAFLHFHHGRFRVFLHGRVKSVVAIRAFEPLGDMGVVAEDGVCGAFHPENDITAADLGPQDGCREQNRDYPDTDRFFHSPYPLSTIDESPEKDSDSDKQIGCKDMQH